MNLKFTDHLKKRLAERKIPLKMARDIFNSPLEYYFDNLRNHHIVVNSVIYKGKHRKMLAAYDKQSLPFSREKRKIQETAEVITTHPITDREIKQRLDLGRWIHEENED